MNQPHPGGYEINPGDAYQPPVTPAPAPAPAPGYQPPTKAMPVGYHPYQGLPTQAAPPQPPRKKHTVRTVLLVVLGVLVILCGVGTIGAALSDKKATNTAATATTQPSTGAKVAVYNSPAQVIDALNHAGLSCGAEKPVDHPGNNAWAMSDCGGDVVISRYANPTAAAASRDVLSAIMKDGGLTGYAVTFGDWLINAGSDKAYAQKVADLFHGELTMIGGAKPSPTKPAVPTIEDGTWTVGVDFPPGSYRVTADVDSDCYWEIDKSGSNGREIIANDIPGGGRPQVTLKVGQDFTTHGCGKWSKVG